MTTNDTLRRLRYTFDLSDDNMMAIFESAGLKASRKEVSSWLKKEDHYDYVALTDPQLATFLNGFITLKRGKKDGPAPVLENRLTNNLVLMKLKIALNLQAEDMLSILALVDFRLSKSELSAFFRKPGHKHYRLCQDQILRNFLHGLQLKYHPNNADDDATATEPN